MWVTVAAPRSDIIGAVGQFDVGANTWRSETAKPEHGGDFYFYLDDTLAIDATKRGTTFSASVAAGNELVLCEVEIKGWEVGMAMAGGRRRRCASPRKLRP